MSKVESKKNNIVRNNAGSALLTVIVFVGFLTVMGTILLYISGINFQIKQNDYQNKKNFYSGETALEEIRAHLMVDASNAATKAYSRTQTRYNELGAGGSRTLMFNKYFAEELKTAWGYRDDGTVPDWDAKLTNYVSNDTISKTKNGSGFSLELKKMELDDVTGVIEEVARPDAQVLDESTIDDGYVTIRGIYITYVNESGYASIISTDIIVRAPELEWNGSSNTMGSITIKNVAGADEVRALDDDASKNYYSKADDTVNIAKSVDYINWVKR